MIEDKNSRTSMKDIKSLNLFADESSVNVINFKGNNYAPDNAEQLYDEMVQATTTEVPSDSHGLMGGSGYQMSMRLSNTIQSCRIKLQELGRTDLIEKFEAFQEQMFLDKKTKEEKVFLDKIESLIDTSKINPEIIPYLIDVEKRLVELEKRL